MIVQFFASILFYLIPYLTGRIFTRNSFLAWVGGSLAWFGLFFAARSLLSYFPLTPFPNLITALIILLSGIGLFQVIRTFPRFSKGQIVVCGTFIIVSAALYFAIWKRETPYPFGLNWDMYEHITLAEKVSHGTLSFFTTRISDTFTFNSYPLFFHILLSLPKMLLSADFFGMYYFLEYWHFFLAAVFSYFLAKKVLVNTWLSLLAALVTLFIFESTDAFTSFFLLPQTLAAQVAIGGVITVLSQKVSKKALFVICAYLILMHYIVGLVACVVLIFLLVAARASRKAMSFALCASLFVVLAALVVNLFATFTLTAREEASHFSYTLLKKLEYFLDWYGVGLPVFLLIGSLTLWRKGSKNHKIFLAASMVLSALVLLPISYAFKFYVLDRYFVNVILGLGIGVLIWSMQKFVRPVAVILLILSFALTFYTNQFTFKNTLYYGGMFSHMTPSEIEASTWLAANASDRALLISDPATQYILEASSGINSQGGAFMSLASRRALANIQGVFSASEIRKELSKIHDTVEPDRAETFLVLSGRYFAWQAFPQEWKESTFYNVWRAEDLDRQEKEYIDFLVKNNPGLKEAYRNEELVIIRL